MVIIKQEFLFSETVKVILWLVTYFTLIKQKGYVIKFCELNKKKMYTYNNMLYKHNKTHFSDFETVFFCRWFVACRCFPSIVHYLSCIILTFTFCHGGWNCQQLFRTCNFFSKNEPVICLFSFSGASHHHISVSSPQMITSVRSQRGNNFLCSWLMPGLCSKLVMQLFVLEKETVMSAGEVWTKMQNQA